MIQSNSIDELTREELQQLLKAYALNWHAHDNCWFLAIEEQYGVSLALDMDREAWRKFSVIEARRLMEVLGLKNNSGVEGLRRALTFRLFSSINNDLIEVVDDKTLRYYIKTCRVQSARKAKGLEALPCSSIGIVEYSYFARTIDDRFETRKISCPPEVTNHYFNCIWEFKLVDQE